LLLDYSIHNVLIILITTHILSVLQKSPETWKLLFQQFLSDKNIEKDSPGDKNIYSQLIAFQYQLCLLPFHRKFYGPRIIFLHVVILYFVIIVMHFICTHNFDPTRHFCLVNIHAFLLTFLPFQHLNISSSNFLFSSQSIFLTLKNLI
jgi:hypothetical protein